MHGVAKNNLNWPIQRQHNTPGESAKKHWVFFFSAGFFSTVPPPPLPAHYMGQACYRTYAGSSVEISHTAKAPKTQIRGLLNIGRLFLPYPPPLYCTSIPHWSSVSSYPGFHSTLPQSTTRSNGKSVCRHLPYPTGFYHTGEDKDIFLQPFYPTLQCSNLRHGSGVLQFAGYFPTLPCPNHMGSKGDYCFRVSIFTVPYSIVYSAEGTHVPHREAWQHVSRRLRSAPLHSTQLPSLLYQSAASVYCTTTTSPITSHTKATS